MMTKRLRPCRLVLSLMLVFVSASSGAAQQERALRHVGDRIGGVPGSIESDLLLPLLMDADDERLVVFDYGDHAVKAFDYSGQLLWSRGRRGAGPGEFGNPTDLRIDANGVTLITDPANQRIEFIARGGDRLQSIRTPPGVLRAVRVQGGNIIGMRPIDSPFLVVLDSLGEVRERIASAPFMREVHQLGREGNIATHDRAVGISFLYSDIILYWSDHADLLRPNAIRGPERVAFASVLNWERNGFQISRIDPGALEGAVAMDVTADAIYVLFGGESELSQRIIDVFHRATGSYSYSILLPHMVESIAVTDGGRIVALQREPLPEINVWTLPR